MSSTIYAPYNYGQTWHHTDSCYSLFEFPVIGVSVQIISETLTVTYPSPHGILVGEFVRITWDQFGPEDFEVKAVRSSTTLEVSVRDMLFPTGTYSGSAQQRQPLLMNFSASPVEGDGFDSIAIEWNYDDCGEESGPVHRIWNACEMCVARLPVNSGNFPAVVEPTYLYYALYPGVFRVYMSEEATVFSFVQVNQRDPKWKIGGSFLDSTPIRLLAGDYVWYSSEFEVHYVFCPYSWP